MLLSKGVPGITHKAYFPATDLQFYQSYVINVILK
jgi:hypothetical protein